MSGGFIFEVFPANAVDSQNIDWIEDLLVDNQANLLITEASTDTLSLNIATNHGQ